MYQAFTERYISAVSPSKHVYARNPSLDRILLSAVTRTLEVIIILQKQSVELNQSITVLLRDNCASEAISPVGTIHHSFAPRKSGTIRTLTNLTQALMALKYVREDSVEVFPCSKQYWF